MYSSDMDWTVSKLLLGAPLLLHSAQALNSLKVDTTVGTVYGMVNGTHPNVAQFLGIPYAEPPVGDLRWTQSVAKSPVGDIDATSLGPSCPQYDTSIPSVYEIDERQFLISGPTSEDCLTVSIWVPYSITNYSEPLPVIVWIYGGGQLTGGAQIEYQIPTARAERSQAHIVVQLNYRLNIFGNPHATGQGPQLNLGLLDQRLALEWIRSNIANFGGNPSKITLWGIILDSSSAIGPAPSSDPQGLNFTFVAGQFGCGNLTPADKLICMRKVDQLEIEAFLKKYQDAGTKPSINFTPIVDNVTRFANYTARALAGNFTKVPAIHGTNNNEGSSLTTWVNNGTTYNSTAANSNTIQRACWAQQTFKNRSAANATTFRYYYTGNFSNISPRPWEGAYHSSELPLIFGTHDIAGPSTEFEYAVSHRMQDLWLAFMRNPVNGLPSQGWQAAVPGGEAIEFGWNEAVTSTIALSEFDDRCDGLNPVPSAVPVDNPSLGVA
ncbi:Alpha/Beta hydrolase protein [Tricladium varicosporioides]|nr:Alpha/Beta hydrolase protein [Hymenoscyphus varicosporioides]